MVIVDILKEAITDVKSASMKILCTNKHNFVLYLVILVLLNVFALSYNFRQDITSDGVYSLSDASISSVKNLNEPLMIKVFFSDDLPAPYSNISLYLKDLLAEYEGASDRNFSVEFMDMSSEEGKATAQSYGVSPIQIQQRTSDEYSAKSSFMGMVFIHGDIIEKMPQVGMMKGLEYLITTRIQKMRGKVDILAGLSSVKVTLYASQTMKAFNINGFDELAPALQGVINKISEENSGKIEFSFNETPSAETIDDLVKNYGVTSVEWKAERLRDGSSIEAGKGVIAITIENDNKSKVINLGVVSTPVGNMIGGLDSLEERIRSSIDTLISNNISIGYVVSGGTRSLQDKQTGAAGFDALLSDLYSIKDIDLTKGSISEEITTLIINGSTAPLSAKELYAIDNYIMRGGNVLFFVDSYREIVPNGSDPRMQRPIYLPLNTGITDLLASYGVTVNKDYILDKSCFVAQQQGQPPMNLYFAPNIFPESLNSDNLATKFLRNMLLVKVSSLTIDQNKLDSNNISHETLISSSPESWLISGNIDLTPQTLQPPSAEELQAYPIAVMLTGTFSSHYGTAKPDFEEVSADGITSVSSAFSVNEHLAKGVTEAKIAIISGTEITSPNMQNINMRNPQQLFAYNNALFLHNLIDTLNDLNDIPPMRSKGIESNLKEVRETSKFAFKVINIAALPIISILIGLFLWRLRLARKKKIQRLFSPEAD